MQSQQPQDNQELFQVSVLISTFVRPAIDSRNPQSGAGADLLESPKVSGFSVSLSFIVYSRLRVKKSLESDYLRSKAVVFRPSIAITTNKSVKDWDEVTAGDEVMTTALLDHLLHRSHVFNANRRFY